MKGEHPTMRILLTVLLLGVCLNLHAQCTDGSQPECTCPTATVLCSVNELDGYSNALADFQHPGDGVDPCGGGTVPNNPNWFAFVAWCEDIDMTIDLSNCSTVGGFTGAQVAVFTDCSGSETVDCESECNGPSQLNLSLNDLTIGEVYYFQIDGCAGSTCDYTISVDPDDCDEEIENWMNPISGDTEVCIGDEVLYEVDDLDGATSYHWFVDGVEVEITDDPEFEYEWTMGGSFQLCVDVSNECVDISEDPLQLCETITVSAPDAGTLMATPNPLCPGEISTVTNTGYNMDPGYEQVLIVVDPNGEVIDVITDPTSESVTYDECGTVTVYALNYADWETSLNIPSVGDTYNGSDCSVYCCDETSIDIDFEDNVDPVFTNPPADLTLVCFDQVPPIMDLEVTDNCSPTAMVTGSEDSNADLCDGGTITREWTFEDDCGNEVMHTQTITIDPLIPADYISPPGDVVIDCDGTIPDPIDLDYTNNGMGACLVSGTVSPVVNGSYDICGTTITYEWDFTDACGNNLNHVQTIEVLPAMEPDFINPPGDLVLQCEDAIPPPTDLEYTNNDSGGCLIQGFATPAVDGAFDACGSEITYEWDFTDACGNNINHIQTIEIVPADEASFVNPPADITLTCDEYTSFSFMDLAFSNGSSGNCEISGMVSPMINDNTDICGGVIEAFYEYTDDCDRTIEHSQTVTLEPAPEASFISTPADMTVSCDAIPGPAGPIDYTNNEAGVCEIAGSIDPVIEEDLDECGGTITNTWEFEDECGRIITHEQVITIEPAPEAMFLSMPPDMSMTCSEFEDFSAVTIDYSNGESGLCLIEGSIDPSTNGNIDECGGIIQFEWEFEDNCGRTILHIQTITVAPAPPPVFLNVPSDVTLDCEDANDDPEFIEYDNGEGGICQIQGFVEAIPVGNVDPCGGTVAMSWTYTDDCNRTISAVQNVTYNPASEPEFEDVPEDLTVDCDEEVEDPDFLFYDNDEDDPCEIAGDVPPVVVINENIYEITWSFTNDCTGNTIEYTQTITKLLPVELNEEDFEFVTCIGNTVDLTQFDVFDINGTFIDITYHDDFPPDDGNEIDEEVVLTELETEYYILATNEYGCSDFATILLIADEENFAGGDIFDDLCIGDGPLDLYSFLEYGAGFDGEFTQLDGPDIDIIDPNEVNITNAEPGVYVFEYYITSQNTCPDDFALIEIELLPPIDLELISIDCSSDANFYTVIISNGGYDIDVSDGMITDVSANSITISGIPIDAVLEIEVEDNTTNCQEEFSFNPPNCDCPMVSTPVSLGDFTICEGEQIPVLNVTVAADETVNWYDDLNAGNLLSAGSTSYQPMVSAPGIYTFYAEAESTIQTGCFGPLRTPVTVEIIPNPVVQDTIALYCNENGTDRVTVNTIEELETILFGGQANLDAGFYRSEDDRETNFDLITFPFTMDSTGHQLLYVRVSNSANCITDVTIDIIVNDPPEIVFDLIDESCVGSNDGLINISINSGLAPVSVLIDEDTLTSLMLNDLAPNIYSFIAVDSIGCRDTFLAEIKPGLDIEFTSFTSICNDNGTSSDETDDFYDISFTVENNGGNSQTYTWSEINSGQNNSVGYGETVNLQLSADGSIPVFNIVDDLLNCALDTSLNALISCSTECILSVDNSSFDCDDNGTPMDPTDDFYTVSITASAINGGSDGTYVVFIDNVLSYSFSYGVLSDFTVPANNQVIDIRIADSQLTSCFTDFASPSLAPCSGDCEVNVNVTNVICNNNGTTNDADDDVFSFEIEVEIINGETSFYIPEVDFTGNTGEIYFFENYLILDGDINWTIQNNGTQICETVINIMPPASCSDPCTIELANLNIGDCEDNGTDQDPSDDTYSIEFTINSVLGNTSQYVIMDNLGNNYGPFDYNIIQSINSIPADGLLLEFTVTDPVNGNCLESFTAEQSPCSFACSISANIVSISCDNNGTQADNDDDLFTAEIQIESTNGSPTGFMTSTGEQGNYGETIIISDLLIADGDVIITITDNDDPTCTQDITLIAPGPCSEPCTIDFSAFDILACEDGGSNTDPSDDTYSVEFTVVATDGNVSQYFINDSNGNTYGPFDYNQSVELGPFDANGADVTLTFYDEQNGTCALTQVINQNSCSGACTIDAVVQNIICDDNGTQGTNDDDLFSFELVVTGVNTSDSFYIASIDYTGAYDEINLIQGLNISIGTQNWEISDLIDGSCPYNITVVPPSPCSNPCTVNLVSLNILSCDDNGTGDNADDDFYFVEIEIENTNGAGSYFNLQDNLGTILPEQWLYDQVNTIGPFSANGNTISFDIVDSDNSNCLLSFDIMQSACSSCVESIDLSVPSTLLTCQNPSIATALEINGTAQSINWNGPQGFTNDSQDIEITSPGWYFVNVIFDNGCTAADSILIDASLDVPISNAGDDLELNCETTIVTLSGVNSTLTQNSEITWLDENNQEISNELELEVSEPGVYTLSIFDAASMCPASTDQVIVTANYNEPSAVIFADPGNIIDCVIESVDLYTPEEPNVIYVWTINNSVSDGSVITITMPANVELLAIDTISHCENMSTLDVQDFTEYPLIDIAPYEDIDCNLNDVCVEITTQTLGNDIQYQWFDEDGNLLSNAAGTICINEAGSYTVAIEDLDNGCANEETFDIAGPVLADVQIESLVSLELNESYTFEPFTNLSQANITSWNWSTEAELSCYDCPNPILLNFENGDIVTVTVISSTGCEASANVTLRLEEDRVLDKYYIPNVFSPGERSNFTIFTSEEITIIHEMYVFDRWGELIFENEDFEPNNPNIGWDGSFGDGDAEQGVYVYLFVFEANGRTMKVAGDITLLR